MNIGVIGTGNIGEVIIRKLRDVGYPVKMAHARGPESLKDLAAQTGAIPVSVEQVVQDVDMLFLVVPQKSIPELPKGFLNKAKKETIVLPIRPIRFQFPEFQAAHREQYPIPAVAGYPPVTLTRA